MEREREPFTVEQFCEYEPAFKPGGVRSKIFHAATNGLADSGAIVRDGRRVLIHRTRFLRWLDGQQQPRAA